MKRFFLCIVAMAAMFVGCENDPAGIKEVQSEPEFSATFDAEETRVYLGEDNYYRWEAGDKVSVFSHDNRNRMYEAASGDVILTDLNFVSKPSTAPGPLMEMDRHYAIFPYSELNCLSFVSGPYYTLSAVLEDEQIHDASKAGLDYAIMTSTIPTEDKVFHFKNSCALIKVNVRTTDDWADEFYLNSIKVESKSNYLAGTVIVEASQDDYTAKIYEDAGNATKTITMSNCESAGQMTPEYKTFIFAIPAGTYPENDLTLTFDCSYDDMDCSVTVPTGYIVNRSEYMEFNVTLDKDFDGTFDWYETTQTATSTKIKIKSPMTLQKALIADVENLNSQAFPYQSKFDYIFDVPSRDTKEFIIEGTELEDNAGGALNVNYNKITFIPEVKAGVDFPVYIMNTFTTLSNGINTIKDYAKVTVNNLIIAGSLRCTTMGIYVNGSADGAVGYPTGAVEGEKAEATYFNTEWNNVVVNDNKIIPYLGRGSNGMADGIGAAVMCYGTAVLNNCQVTGTQASALVQLREDLQGIPLYDMAGDNSAKVTINGGKVGNIYGWEHSSYTFKGGAEIGTLTTKALYIAKKYISGVYTDWQNAVVVEDATVGTLYALGNGSYTAKDTYATKIDIKAAAKISVLKFGALLTNFSRVTIEEGATVGTVILEGQGTDGADLEMTLDEFKANYLN
ncbi:MAG: hypothetical protein IKB14_04495 [Rikenellaceae bacterium]|nr:hypothetical protein [Rikenellaceae bacterium]MBR2419959.1 hypothetical protein [Rikenellaceae bacterium]MBR3801721.1 hypothetical protein [Rikenellaceae bacterium]